MVELESLKEKLDDDLHKQVVSSRILLSKFRLIEEASRKTSAFVDGRYIPFYYYLGKYIQPANLLEIGFRLALFSGCFLQSCKSVLHFLAFQEESEEFYSPKLGLKNIHDHYRGSMDVFAGDFISGEFQAKLRDKVWDLVIINEELTYDRHRLYLDLMWPQLADDGLIVADYIESHKPAGQAFLDFCKIQNRTPIQLETRYGVGIVQK